MFSLPQTSNRYLFEYVPSNLQRLFSFQFCRSLTNFYGRLCFVKCRNMFSDCQSRAFKSSLHFHFRLPGNVVDGFPIRSRGICALLFRILKTNESSFRFTHYDWFFLTNSLPPRAFRYRFVCYFESAVAPQTLKKTIQQSRSRSSNREETQPNRDPDYRTRPPIALLRHAPIHHADPFISAIYHLLLCRTFIRIPIVCQTFLLHSCGVVRQ